MAKREIICAFILLFCVSIVLFWEIMAIRSSMKREPFRVTAENFVGFNLIMPGWQIRQLAVGDDPIEANILVYEVEREDVKYAVRLAHGYNVRDCMRIKGYEVDLIGDQPGNADAPRIQLWRLVSPTCVTSLWATSTLFSGDFSDAGVDSRNMAFPSVGIPDDAGWTPEGLTWKSLRNPMFNFRKFARSKWNAARRDIFTLLRLKPSAWASDSVLTLITAWNGDSIASAQEISVKDAIIGTHRDVFNNLRAWAGRTARQDVH